MKRTTVFLFLFLQYSFYACNDRDQPSEARQSDDLSAARGFIEAALRGEYDRAHMYMLRDSVNEQYFDVFKRNFTRLDGEEKRNYRQASINVHDVTPVNDSTSIIIFSNSYKKDRDTLKILRMNGKWLVDFKYLFLHAADSLRNDPGKQADSVR